MAYDKKNVFYLDTSLSIVNGQTGNGSKQLDISAYVDPIARGRTKGTGLAIYKVHFDVSDNDGNTIPSLTEVGCGRMMLGAGLGTGDVAVGSLTGLANDTLNAANDLAIAGFDFYGADAFGTSVNGVTPAFNGFYQWVMPSEDVPYIVVRDNVCLITDVLTAFGSASQVNIRMECAQVTLDQATLNQLLRTQTV